MLNIFVLSLVGLGHSDTAGLKHGENTFRIANLSIVSVNPESAQQHCTRQKLPVNSLPQISGFKLKENSLSGVCRHLRLTWAEDEESTDTPSALTLTWWQLSTLVTVHQVFEQLTHNMQDSGPRGLELSSK